MSEKGLHGCMLHKNGKKKPGNATLAGVKKEMAKPRMARSARIAELKMDTSRKAKKPSTTLLGIVEETFPRLSPSQPENAQIAIHGADRDYRDLRIENTLTDEHGDDVRLKKGARVDVTVTATDSRS